MATRDYTVLPLILDSSGRIEYAQTSEGEISFNPLLRDGIDRDDGFREITLTCSLCPLRVGNSARVFPWWMERLYRYERAWVLFSGRCVHTFCTLENGYWDRKQSLRFSKWVGVNSGLVPHTNPVSSLLSFVVGGIVQARSSAFGEDASPHVPISRR